MKPTKEQWESINASRERMQAFRIKCGQPFPPLPEPTISEPLPIPEPEWTKRQWYIVRQYQANVEHLRGELYKALKEIKAKSKDDSLYE